ncbi:MAG: hypothetical protein N4A47_03875 [Clostridia bacterium]|jgi:hypothetical protein|nr:hypothetical protein [Clostridia bacterium]
MSEIKDEFIELLNTNLEIDRVDGKMMPVVLFADYLLEAENFSMYMNGEMALKVGLTGMQYVVDEKINLDTEEYGRIVFDINTKKCKYNEVNMPLHMSKKVANYITGIDGKISEEAMMFAETHASDLVNDEIEEGL